jgi:gluconokinase
VTCTHILVMGVAGSGKSTIGAALAGILRAEFIEGDEHHPPANVEKMAAGIPLTDADREPWLARLAEVLADRHAHGESTVLACSALRRAYRDRLRASVPGDESFGILLVADAQTLEHHLEARRGHYMPASLLESQLATLEPLESDEAGATIDAMGSPPDVVAAALAAVRARHGTLPPGR